MSHLTERTAMKRIVIHWTLSLACCAWVGAVNAQDNIAVNNTGALSDPSAILDVSSNYTGPATQKGFLVPRMTQGQRGALTGVEGLLVYQTNGTTGFYYFANGSWELISEGKTNWALRGNDLNTPVVDYFGSSDNSPVRFVTNSVERMRFTPTGEWALDQTVALERVDVGGAIRITGTTANTNIGTIRWNDPDSCHEGYMGPAQGWRKLENDYRLIRNAAYTQQNQATCGSGNSVIPDNTGLSSFSAALLVTPFPNGNTLRRARHQYLFKREELNVELAQLAGNTDITSGLCPDGSINTIGFYKQGGVGAVKNWGWQVSIFHVPIGVNDLSGGFQNNTDPTFGCAVNTNNFPTTTAAGWHNVALAAPFQWDGVRNIVVEVCMNSPGPGIVGGEVPVAVTTIAGANNQVTYSKNAISIGGTCSDVGPLCGGTPTQGCGMDATCLQTSGGSTNVRPVIRFNGTVSSTPGPAIVGNGDYIHYNGGFITELNPGWRFTVAPAYSFRGPGAITVENGVYDNGVRLSDHVFDKHFDGRVHMDDLDHAGEHHNLSVEEMSAFVAEQRHLPTMKGRSEWDRNGAFSLGDLTTQLWTTTETQALYLVELHKRAELLEALSTRRPIAPEEFAPMRETAIGMHDLSEREKRVLVDDLGERIIPGAQ
ncbi:MAG: hypothetical protein KDB88_01075 [Flavobacteriales bacterium]|nr:hypothetical protein [Flavobacteriales bacterium]